MFKSTDPSKLHAKAQARYLRADELDRLGNHMNARTVRKRAEKLDRKAETLSRETPVAA